MLVDVHPKRSIEKVVAGSDGRAPCGLRTDRLSVSVAQAGNRTIELVRGVSFYQETGCFHAIVGQSGCGKSTLLKALSGVIGTTSGSVTLNGYDVADFGRTFRNATAYLPQFGSFHEEMAVAEILCHAAALRLPRNVSSSAKQAWLKNVSSLSGLAGVLGQRYKTLSGGQTRRLALAEALVADPAFLFLDELTSGLDEYSDREMMLWLRTLAHAHGKTILLVTHATYHLELCDSILLLHRGQLAFQGPYSELLEAHGVASMGEVFAQYQDGAACENVNVTGAKVEDAAAPSCHLSPSHFHTGESPDPQPIKSVPPPGGFEQFPTLLWRQALLFWRDRGSLWLHLALVITFPILVAVFATKGLPQVRQLTLGLETNVVKTLHDQLLFLKESFQASALLSGLAMFQVILLTLMGANNGSREIAREWEILRKELRAGLSPVAYVGSKFVQVLVLSLVQACWMAWFVKTICGFPGAFLEQFAILFATVLAMGTTCLAISAGCRSAERASLLSIYLVGFQLPLSGAALALPDWLNMICRPFISAYWGWSGYLQTLHATRHYDIVKQASKTAIAPYEMGIGVLSLHVLVALILAWWFVRKTAGAQG